MSFKHPLSTTSSSNVLGSSPASPDRKKKFKNKRNKQSDHSSADETDKDKMESEVQLVNNITESSSKMKTKQIPDSRKKYSLH